MLQVIDGSGTIPAGFAFDAVCVLVKGDHLIEPNETLFVVIDTPTNAVLGNSVGELTIENDDQLDIDVIDFEPSVP